MVDLALFPHTCQQLRKKGAFLLPKIEISPSNPTSEKIIASFKVLSWFDTIIHQKIEKVSQKKYFLNDFTSNHPIATQIPDLDNFFVRLLHPTLSINLQIGGPPIFKKVSRKKIGILQKKLSNYQ